MKTKLTLIPAIAIAAIAMSTNTAEARGGNPLVKLAHEIEDIADELKDEFRIHYRHSGAYRHLMNDITVILEEAEHIDGLAHDPHSSLRHIKADLEDLDDLAHHLHEVVDHIHRYPGHVDGDDRHVHKLLDELNATIHSMERYVVSLATPPRHTPRYVHRDHHDHRDHGSSRKAEIIGGVIRGILEISRDRDHCRH